MKRRSSLASCLGKKQYEDIHKALYGKRCLKERGENGLHVYRCQFCKHWHIGHSMTYMTDYPAYGKAKWL